MIDLHTHSTFSDGSQTPKELAEQAKRIGLTAIALTDHDCTDGLDLFLDTCIACGIIGIPGVEISADMNKGTMHILGYMINHKKEALQSMLKRIREGRSDRNEKILEKLNKIGFALTWNEVAELAEEEVVGRPHFAAAMLKKGYIPSKEAAFDLYLGKGKPAYCDRFRLSPADSIAAINNAGGVAVLAHPFTLELNPQDMRDCVKSLQEHGLGGIEVHYSEHTKLQTEQYLKLAKEFGLLVTGGSDFHGEMNPAVKLGYGFGSLNVSDELAFLLQKSGRQRDGDI